jgi:hypothetical protein
VEQALSLGLSETFDIIAQLLAAEPIKTTTVTQPKPNQRRLCKGNLNMAASPMRERAHAGDLTAVALNVATQSRKSSAHGQHIVNQNVRMSHTYWTVKGGFMRQPIPRPVTVTASPAALKYLCLDRSAHLKTQDLGEHDS